MDTWKVVGITALTVLVMWFIFRKGTSILGKGLAAGAPASGEALPQRESVAPQDTRLGARFKDQNIGPPADGVVRFGSIAQGGLHVVPDASQSLRPPGSYNMKNFGKRPM